LGIQLQHGNDGVRLLAVKFVETTVLLFTPDPSGSSQPPLNQQNSDGVAKGFNIAWIAGGHPLLDANALGQEASKNLGLLLNQLRAPESSVLPGPVAIVLVNRYVSLTGFFNIP
jgi:symplekin